MGQRHRRKALNGGAWVQELKELIEEASRYSILKRLPEALQLIDPDTSSAAAVEHQSDIVTITDSH